MLFFAWFFTGFLANFLSLYFVSRKVVLNPAFVIGDYFLVPLYFGLSTNLLKYDFNFWLLVPALLVVLFWSKRFNLLKPVWIPHGLVAWVIIVIFLTALMKDLSLALVLGLILVIHQILGYLFPKILTR